MNAFHNAHIHRVSPKCVFSRDLVTQRLFHTVPIHRVFFQYVHLHVHTELIYSSRVSHSAHTHKVFLQYVLWHVHGEWKYALMLSHTPYIHSISPQCVFLHVT